jgi:hypothetical protein
VVGWPVDVFCFLLGCKHAPRLLIQAFTQFFRFPMCIAGILQVSKSGKEVKERGKNVLTDPTQGCGTQGSTHKR